MMKKTINISGRQIGSDYPPFVIAEISGNHNGSMEKALQIIKFAKDSGADAVKLQTYTADTMTVNSTKKEFKISQGLWEGRTLYDLYEWAHTPWEWHKELFEYASSLDLIIFSTPFDHSAVDFLEELNVPAFKIASFEVTDLNLIKRVASTRKPMIISTGMANDKEIKEAIKTAKKNGCEQLAILHCVSGYPAPSEDYNLHTISDMIKNHDLVTGLSDHTLSNLTAISSVALGASIIEKHVTLDRNGGGPDDSFSLEPRELKSLCSDVLSAWNALGEVNYKKKPSEEPNIIFRRSLYFVKSLKQGQKITKDSIRCIRPGYGLEPKYLDSLIGKTLLKDVEENSPVSLDVVG